MRMISIGNGRAVVVTGASTGIGAACAVHLDRLGFMVFAGVRKSQDGATLQQQGAGVIPLILDVTDGALILKAQQQVLEKCGSVGLYGLINNAGIAVVGPLEGVPISDLRKQLEINVIGQIAVTQAFLPLIRKARGRIVNMGSIAGRGALPLMGPYSASKFALEAMTDALRLELQQWGIHVSIVEPGAIATPIWEKSGKDAAALEVAMPMHMRSLYATLVAAVRKVVGEASARAIATDAVSQAVEHALTAFRPKTRYLVGMDAKLRAVMMTLLPDRLSDAVLTWALKLPR